MRKNNMRKIRHFLLVLCVVALGSGWVSTVFAQTAIDLHTGRVTKASPNENPMSKQRIMARDRALATQDSLDYNEAVAKAFLLLRKDSLSQAQHELERALRLRPKAETNAVLRLNLAKIYYWRKQWHDADRTLREVREEFARQLVQKGNVKTSLEAVPQENLQSLLNETCTWQHNTLYQLGKYQLAADSIQAFLQQKPELSPHEEMDVCTLLGDCYFALKNYDAAVAAYKRTLKIEANAFEALLPMAQALQALHREEEALMWLNSALQYENYEEPLVARAKLHRAMANEEAALADWEVLVKENPQNLQYQVARAEMLLAVGKKKKAKDAVKKLLHAGFPHRELPAQLQEIK